MKRNIFTAICLAAVVVLSASCSQDSESAGFAAYKRVTFTGITESIEGETRAYNACCYEVRWNKNDKIYVTNGTNDDMFTLVDGEGTPAGVFTEDNEKGVTGDIEAFYPASLKTDDGFVWPATQSNDQVAPMYAKQTIKGSENEVVSFSSLGGMLQIVFNTKTEGITVTSITLEHNKKPLSGKFTVDENGQAIMADNSEHPGVTLDLGTGVEMGSSAKYFYIAIPAGTYSTAEKDEVMTITFNDDIHLKECVMTSTTFPEVKRNTVGKITLAKDFTDLVRTVKFDLNNTDMTGGFTDKPSDIKVANGSTFTAPAMLYAENYGFRGWYKDADCTTPYDFSSKVTEDMTLYAKWVADPTGSRITGHDCVKLAGYYWSTVNYDDSSGYYPENPWHCVYFTYEEAIKVARHWGSESGHSWKLPSKAQWQALIDKCNWEWKDETGYIVTGKKENYEDGHSITLLAAGFYFINPKASSSRGDFGCYWAVDGNLCFYFDKRHKDMSDLYSRYALSVRPVAE